MDASDGDDALCLLMRRHAELLATELEPKYPEFTRDLKHAVHETHWRQETQCARALIALQRRDAGIDALRRELERKADTTGAEAVVSTRAVAVHCGETRWRMDAAVIAEQREQIDVLLDELENLHSALDAQRRVAPQVMDESVQTIDCVESPETAMVAVREVHASTEDQSIRTESQKAADKCPSAAAAASLQRACAFMQLSSTCSASLSVTSALESSECVDLEHRLQTQAAQLSHIRRCFDQFREHVAVLLASTLQDQQSQAQVVAFDSRDLTEEVTSGSFSSFDRASVLERVISQLMQQSFSSAHSRLATDDQWRLLLDEISKSADCAGGCDDVHSVHAAAMIQQWAGWEAAHAQEIKAIRQSCANELALIQHRVSSQIATVHQSYQREVDLQAEVNVLKRILDKRSETEASVSLTNSEATARASSRSRGPSYSELLLQSTHLQQKLYEQTERLNIAERAVGALSSANPTKSHQDDPSATSSGSDAVMSQVLWLTCELQKAKQNLSRFSQRNQDLLLQSSRTNMLESEILTLRRQLAAEQHSRRTTTAERDVCKKELGKLDQKMRHIEMRLLAYETSQSSAVKSRSRPSDLLGEYGIKLYQLQFLEQERQQLLDRMVRVQTHALVLEQQVRGIEHSSVVTGVNQILENAMNVFKRVSDYYEQVVTQVPTAEALRELIDSTADKTIGSCTASIHLVDCPESRELKTHLSAVLSASDVIWFAFQELYSIVCGLLTGPTPSFGQQTHLTIDEFVVEITKSLRVSEPGTSWLSQSIELQNLQEKQFLLQKQLSDKDLRLHAQSQCILRAGIALDDLPFIATTADAAVQTFRYKKQRSRSVQTVSIDGSLSKRTDYQSSDEGPNETPTQGEGEPLQQPEPLTSEAPHDTITTSKYADNIQADLDIMQELRHTQQELERSVARISDLTRQNEELTQRLRRSNKAMRKYSKDCKELLSQLTTSANTNALLSDALSRGRTVPDHHAPPASSKNEDLSDTATHEQVSALMNDLASREQENLSLVQSLMEIQAKYSKSKECRSELEAKLRELHNQQNKAAHDKDVAHVSSLEGYMKRVEANLANLELEKKKVDSENQALKAKLEQSIPQIPTASTEIENESAWYVQEREKLQDQISSLIEQVKFEQRRFEDLNSTMEEKRNQEVKRNQIAMSALEQEHQKQENWMSELRRHHNQLQQEFAEYQNACREAQEESEARIAFLAACVEECSRLVDSPANQEMTTKDLHDAVVSISRNVVSLKTRQAGNKQRGAKSATAHSKLGAADKTHASGMADLTELGMDDATVLALDAWKIRASKLEQLLLASRLKMQTFEVMAQRVEGQLEDLKTELKERMTKEALLLTKNTALKSDIAALKTQQGSISVQYSQAFESLKVHKAQLSLKEEELARLRLAIQRKSELLTRQKEKTDVMQKELESIQGKLAGLAGVEQRFAGFQQKTKEQSQQFQELKRQCAVFQEQQSQLTAQLEREQVQYGSLQARYKAVRSENARLRSHIADLKAKWKVDSNAKESETRHTLQTKVGSIDEIKSLKRRMLQKQEVIGNYKAKLADLEQQMEIQRSKIAELAHANRLLSQEQRTVAARAEKEVSELQNELEAQLSLRSARLDGLRASVYDSFEASLHCSRNSLSISPTSSSSSSSSSSSFTASMVSEVHESDRNMADLQRWTELSTHDLLELDVHHKRHRAREAPAQRKIQGRRALRSLETALEESPEDCRPEICQVLSVLCGQRATASH